MIDRFLKRMFGPVRPGLGQWAEAGLRRTFPVEPLNTVSCLAYLAAGAAIALLFDGPLAHVFVVALEALGLGSALLHGWPNRRTRAADHATMYGAFTVLAAAALGLSWPIVALAGIGGAALGAVVTWPTEYAMGLTLGGTVALLTADGGLPPLGVASIAVFLLSYGVWRLGVLRWRVGRGGHPAWHVGTALATALMMAAVLVRRGLA